MSKDNFIEDVTHTLEVNHLYNRIRGEIYKKCKDQNDCIKLGLKLKEHKVDLDKDIFYKKGTILTTIIRYAIERKNIKVVTVLLYGGVDLSLEKYADLYWFATQTFEKDPTIYRLLIQFNVRFRRVDVLSLIGTFDVGFVEILKHPKCDINEVYNIDGTDHTLLTHASTFNKIRLINILLDNGANPSYVVVKEEKYRVTPIVISPTHHIIKILCGSGRDGKRNLAILLQYIQTLEKILDNPLNDHTYGFYGHVDKGLSEEYRFPIEDTNDEAIINLFLKRCLCFATSNIFGDFFPLYKYYTSTERYKNKYNKKVIFTKHYNTCIEKIQSSGLFVSLCNIIFEYC